MNRNQYDIHKMKGCLKSKDQESKDKHREEKVQKAGFTNRVDATLGKTANYGRTIDKQRENVFWLLGI